MHRTQPHRRRKGSDGHAIHSPGRRLLKRIALRFVRDKVAGGGRRSVSEGLNLTAFIDFMLVTVIFLLMGFSASGQLPDETIDVPEAANGSAMLDAPLVSVDGNQVRVNGHQVGSARAAYDMPGLVKLDGLFAVLTETRHHYATLEPGQTFPGTCILQIDEGVPARVVKSVFHTAAMAGYENISFMVKPRQTVLR